jgi:transcription antitermination protein NusB
MPGRRDAQRRAARREVVKERRRARRRALDILYQADVTRRPALEVLEERRELEDLDLFTEELVRGVTENAADLDRLVGEHAEEWTVHRMAVVDRNVLRLACYEMLWRDDVPVAVAIDEAVEAAKELSTEDSGRFVNGILGRIARERAGTT